MLLEKTAKRSLSFIITALLMIPSLGGCHRSASDENKDKAERIVSVEEKPNVVKLYYSGVIKPINVFTITSPVDGVVTTVKFHYGQAVKKDEEVLFISSTKLEEQFHEAVKSYLKAKDQYVNSQVSMQGATELYKFKIISLQEFTNEKSQFQNNELAFVDAKFKLQQVLETVPGVGRELENLTLHDIDKIKKIFENHLENIPITSDESGIILYPVKKAGNDDSSKKEIEVGVDIKQGQAIVSVGDLSGVSVEFQVGENDINRIQADQKVKLSIPAIEGDNLDGIIKSLGVQAKDEGRSGESAQFPVRVDVPEISENQRKLLRVGMTAKIEVDLVGGPVIMLPISAVSNDDGKYFVTVLTENGKREKREVTPGRTTLNEVTIVKGLRSGEKVIVYD